MAPKLTEAQKQGWFPAEYGPVADPESDFDNITVDGAGDDVARLMSDVVRYRAAKSDGTLRQLLEAEQTIT